MEVDDDDSQTCENANSNNINPAPVGVDDDDSSSDEVSVLSDNNNSDTSTEISSNDNEVRILSDLTNVGGLQSNDVVNINTADNTNNSEEVPKFKQYQKCCVPGCQHSQVNAFYRRLPACPPKDLTSALDKVRKTYATKFFKRKEWLRRLGFDQNQCPYYMLYCDSHELESTHVTIEWRGKDGLVNECLLVMELPRDASEHDILTREDHRRRIIVDPHIPILPKKRRTNGPNRKPKSEYAFRWCCYVNCSIDNKCDNVFFCRVPTVPKHVPTEDSSDAIRYTYAKSLAYRAEFLRRIGAPPNDPRREIRICNRHFVERLKKY